MVKHGVIPLSIIIWEVEYCGFRFQVHFIYQIDDSVASTPRPLVDQLGRLQRKTKFGVQKTGCRDGATYNCILLVYLVWMLKVLLEVNSCFDHAKHLP